MIKKIYLPILLSIICWLNVSTLQAQLQEQKHNFSIGISGGVNLGNVDFSPRIKQGYLIGPQAGFTTRYISEKYFEYGNGARFILNLGPQISFLINEKEKHAMPSIEKEQYGKAAENGFDYGLIGGGGVEIRTGIGHFLIEGRYYFGLSDFFNTTKKDYFSRSAHTYICGKITYLFDITK